MAREKDIYLVRHGECESNRAGPTFEGIDSLTKKGVQQAQITAQHLSERTFSRLFASDALRALETAQIFSLQLGLPAEPSELFREIALSRGSGRDAAVAATEIERVRRAVEFILDLETGNIIVVAHAEFIKMFIGILLLGNTLNETSARQFVTRLHISNCSISIVQSDGGHQQDVRLMNLNTKGHLQMPVESYTK